MSPDSEVCPTCNGKVEPCPGCKGLGSRLKPPPFEEGRKRYGHKGVKLSRFDLLPYDALWQVTLVLGRGAVKYAQRNWERGYEWSKSHGAAQRHLALYWQGEDTDEETGLPHLAHAICNLLFLLAFSLRKVGTDDRSKHIYGMTAEVTNPEDIKAAKAEVKDQ